ncbi:MAG: DUF177 domain-containing protein [Betaproteobacteria bacterium]
MSDRATLDAVQFADSGAELTGEFAISDLQRLVVFLREPGGSLSYRAIGHRRGDGKPAIRLELRGQVVLTCQRCLESMEQRLEVFRELVFVEQSGFGDVTEEEADADYLPADLALDLKDLVEDEALLCLPMAPKHEIGECPAQGLGAESALGRNPFSMLSILKKH